MSQLSSAYESEEEEDEESISQLSQPLPPKKRHNMVNCVDFSFHKAFILLKLWYIFNQSITDVNGTITMATAPNQVYFSYHSPDKTWRCLSIIKRSILREYKFGYLDPVSGKFYSFRPPDTHPGVKPAFHCKFNIRTAYNSLNIFSHRINSVIANPYQKFTFKNSESGPTEPDIASTVNLFYKEEIIHLFMGDPKNDADCTVKLATIADINTTVSNIQNSKTYGTDTIDEMDESLFEAGILWKSLGISHPVGTISVYPDSFSDVLRTCKKLGVENISFNFNSRTLVLSGEYPSGSCSFNFKQEFCIDFKITSPIIQRYPTINLIKIVKPISMSTHAIRILINARGLLQISFVVDDPDGGKSPDISYFFQPEIDSDSEDSETETDTME